VRSQPLIVGLLSRNSDTVIPWAFAIDAHVSPCFALTVRVHALGERPDPYAVSTAPNPMLMARKSLCQAKETMIGYEIDEPLSRRRAASVLCGLGLVSDGDFATHLEGPIMLRRGNGKQNLYQSCIVEPGIAQRHTRHTRLEPMPRII
jgi:hypothetical protein